MYRRLGILLCLVVMLGVVNGASAALIAHWPLDGDAQDVVDGHHGTLVGGAAFVEDSDRGIVLSVDGGDGCVVVPHAEDMEFAASDSYTIAAWAYIEAVTGTWQAVMAQSREQGDHYGIWVTDAGDWMGGGWENRGSKVPLKVWVHVAYAQNGATGAATTYVNGVAELRSEKAREKLGIRDAGSFELLAQNFLNDASRLLEFEERGRFRFWDTAALQDFVAKAGFSEVSTQFSFGDPPQAIVVTAQRP